MGKVGARSLFSWREMNIVFVIGTAILLGTLGGRVFQKFKIPAVVGYITIGLLLGESFWGLVNRQDLEIIRPLINFILGIIGFLIGSELKSEIFKKYGKSIYTILISEGMLAFIFTTLAVTLITGKLYLGLILGAIASATDPASTVGVLWEYKTKGPLTTTLTSIVALDDGLALILYGFVSVFSKSMLGRENFSWLHSLGFPLVEIGQSILVGVFLGFILVRIMTNFKEKGLVFALMLGGVAVAVGISMYLKLDLILSSMILGITVSNLAPRRSERLFEELKTVSLPLYILFFIIVGASINLHIFLKISVLVIVLGYLVGRSLGKILGAAGGAIISRAKRNVIRYTGICLFTQGGVALGLAMSISHNLSYLGEEGKKVGAILLSVVGATTFMVQLIGPVLVSWGVKKADETFRNVTEEDIIELYKVEDLMEKDFSVIREDAPLDKIIETIKEKEIDHFPVVDREGHLIGSVSLRSLRSVLAEDQLNKIILARDVAQSVDAVVYPSQPLKSALRLFERMNLDYLVVVEGPHSLRAVGVLEYQSLRKTISRKLLERQHTLED